jgi:hypothetical protein
VGFIASLAHSAIFDAKDYVGIFTADRKGGVDEPRVTSVKLVEIRDWS